ncbi:MAG: diguanylate cyclase, partial [Sulfurimonadaceae bacterium]|nr:diguanylate cyclase [Sulfurimonadaceae bacterium]
MQNDFIKKSKLTLFLSLFFFIIILLFSILNYRFANDAISKYATNIAKEINLRVDTHLESFFNAPSVIISMNEEAFKIAALDIDDIPALQKRFVLLMKNMPYITFISFGNTKGEYIGASRIPQTNEYRIFTALESENMNVNTFDISPQNTRGEKLKDGILMDARTRPWFMTAQTSQQTTWYPVYKYHMIDGLGIGISAPLYNPDTKEFQGAISADLALIQISNYLKTIDVGKNGMIFIAEKNGDLLATSSSKDVFEIYDDILTRYNLTTYPDKRLNQITKLQENEGNSYFILDDDIYLVNSLNFKDKYGLDLIIGVVIAQKDFMSDFKNNLNLHNILIVILSIFGFMTILFLSRKIEQSNKKLMDISITDELTQIYNRRHFNTMLNYAMSMSDRTQNPLALFMLDIDYFKKYNDLYGHVQGDICLQ